ncbi:penicillin-insensitive murein endopeptidase [Pseudoroseicyclus aestuarii]|uniref:Penicillin-insensitive murein endopeptidase n=1 Tax=Pseudoroseicyclus aestuarii TaxID=1795041 RepID=A0A318T7C2_9RHOB|nr:penicillin-insensitive murein endopeptidase [Pseudoroseicyclus aestuarii]PYE84298.1 penicillin-insensitive murein endopeptidase [Pseudoroseicyclus aestuarii]
MTPSLPRLLASGALALGLGLAACGPASGPGGAALQRNLLPADPSLNAGDTRLAQPLLTARATPSAHGPEALGFYSAGCQAGAQALPESGPTWQAMRLSRNRFWGQPDLIDYIEDLSRAAAQLPGWEGIYVGDMSQPRGGPMPGSHASHQNGIDVDIWLDAPQRLDLTRAEREAISASNFQRGNGAYSNSAWTPQHEALLRAAASDPRTERIFIFPGAKVSMCENATGDRSWLRKIRPWYGHADHIHVRLNCPAGNPGCEPQDPIPPGDGCQDARDWVNNILNPPPPDPNWTPAPPKPPVTMASLPPQCTAVLNSN